jgi:formylglycine-generating enzyme required for sulfatase activity/TolB-like protein
MKRSIFCLTAFLCFGATAWSQSPKVAVLDVSVPRGIDASISGPVTDAIISEMVASMRYTILDRANIAAILQEKEFQLSGDTNDKEVAKAGSFLGASYVVVGKIQMIGSAYYLGGKMIDVSTGAIVNQALDSQTGDLAILLEMGKTIGARLSGGERVTPNPAQTAAAAKPQAAAPAPAAATVSGPDPAFGGLVLVQGGSFKMGDTAGLGVGSDVKGLYEAQPDEKPLRTVAVSSFYISPTEVTQEEFFNVLGINRSYYKNDKAPVDKVSWYDCLEYCNKRSIQEGLTPAYTIDKSKRDPNNSNAKDKQKWIVTWNANADGYRLPTEAEWEFAARGGLGSKGCVFSGSNEPDEVGWSSSTSTASMPVGQKKPNELGLFDMSGNVWEWCWDWYGPYDVKAIKDPRGPNWGARRVIRGGGWTNPVQDQRVCNRGDTNYDFAGDINLGFRVARNAPAR